MNKLFELTNANRLGLLKICNTLTKDQLNYIPIGHRNNIAWNLGHIVAIQQRLLYGLTTTQFIVQQAFVEKYNKGTFPEGIIENDELETINEYLINTIPQAKTDWLEGKFNQVIPFDTRIKVRLESFEDLVNFNFFHEGIHTGIILSMMKQIK